MATIRDLAKWVFRAFVDDGIPSSGANEPDKGEIIGLFGLVEDTVGASIPVTYPGHVLRQKVTQFLKRGTGSGGLTPIVPGLTRSPQGMTLIYEEGEYRVLLKQRTTVTDDEEAEGFGGQLNRLVCYRLEDIGQAESEPLYYTFEMDTGHQAIGAFPWVSGPYTHQVWTSSTTAYGTIGGIIPRNLGVARIKWRGAATTADDITTIQLLVDPADPTSAAKKVWNSVYFGASGLCSADGKYVAMIVQHIQDTYRSDGVRYALIYDRVEVEAAAAAHGGDATSVRPIRQFRLYVPDEMDAESFQDFHIENEVLWSFSGQTYPFGRHYVIAQNIWTGEVLAKIVPDDVLSMYSETELFDNAGGLVMGAREMEGGFILNGQIYCVIQEDWRQAGAIVSYNGLGNFYSRASTNTLRPGDDEHWAPTWKAPTLGEWDPVYNSSLGYPGMGAQTLVRAVVVRIGVATGDPNEKPLERGVTEGQSTAAIPLPRSKRSISSQRGDAFTISQYSSILNRFEDWIRFLEGYMSLWDRSRRGENTRVGFFQNYCRTTSAGHREYVNFGYGDTIQCRIYGPGDVAFPSRALMVVDDAGAAQTVLDFTKAAGIVVGKAGGGTISIETLNTTVAALNSGFLRPTIFTRQTLPTPTSGNKGGLQVSNPEAGKSFYVVNADGASWKYLADQSAVALV